MCSMATPPCPYSPSQHGYIVTHSLRLRTVHRSSTQRPKFDWNKGKAVEYILDQIGKDIGEPIYPIYLGDDVSDEDAFAVLQERGGLGILISNGMVAQGQTKASFRLRSPREVADILAKLSAICDGQE